MLRQVLAVDQGTTGTTVLLLDERARIVRRAYREITQHYPRPGWVEHDPVELWESTLALMKQVARVSKPGSIAAIGLTNQRETTILWDRRNGRPLHRAIVWQDRRTSGDCDRLRKQGLETAVRIKTGLVLDAYFSATKIRWLLENAPRAWKVGANIAFGTVDSWLLWKLTGGAVHATDPTNASRTLLYDIHRRQWDEGLLKAFGVPASILPKVSAASAGHFGTTTLLGGEIPITGIAGDQQAALFGQCCWDPGTVKNTYGTGCFAVLNTGKRAVKSAHGLLTTLACDGAGAPCYALEGSVFVAGAVVQWLRDELRVIPTAAAIEKLARSAKDSGGVVFVPAFAGLGAPYWDMDARGAILGLTRGSGRAEIARAALESIAFQTRDVIDAMTGDTGMTLERLRVDGGATANDLLMQIQADVLGVPVERPANIQSTALGAAFLAGLGAGVWSGDQLGRLVRVDKVFSPKVADREGPYAAWKAAVERVRKRP